MHNQKTVTKKDIARQLTELLSQRSENQVIRVNLETSSMILQDITDIIVEGIETHGRVSIRDLGVFERVHKDKKLARNVRANTPHWVEPYTTVKLKASKAIKRRLTRR